MRPERMVDWLEAVPGNRNRWRLTRNLHYVFAGIQATATRGYETDLFTAVGNTTHPELWRSAILHDWICDHPDQFPREVGDVAFISDMLAAAFAIYRRRISEGVPEPDARREMIKIAWRAVRYFMGVRVYWRLKRKRKR